MEEIKHTTITIMPPKGSNFDFFGYDGNFGSFDKIKIIKNMEFLKEHLAVGWLPVVEQFPKIFLEPSKYVQGVYDDFYKTEGITQDQLVNLRYGFEHGIGWKDIVIGFCTDLQKLADKAAAAGHTFQYQGCIIKEKFGKFTPQGDLEKSEGAWGIYRDEYYDICRKWEEKSLTVCEVCGKDGKLHSTGWWKTRCDEHN